MKSRRLKSKTNKGRLDTLIYENAAVYLVSYTVGKSKAVYKRIGGGNTKLVTIIDEKEANRCSNRWPLYLGVAECKLYGKKINATEIFLEML